MRTWQSEHQQEEQRLLQIYRELSTRDKLRVRGYAEAIAATPTAETQPAPTFFEFLASLIGRASWAR